MIIKLLNPLGKPVCPWQVLYHGIDIQPWSERQQREAAAAVQAAEDGANVDDALALRGDPAVPLDALDRTVGPDAAQLRRQQRNRQQRLYYDLQRASGTPLSIAVERALEVRAALLKACMNMLTSFLMRMVGWQIVCVHTSTNPNCWALVVAVFALRAQPTPWCQRQRPTQSASFTPWLLAGLGIPHSVPRRQKSLGDEQTSEGDHIPISQSTHPWP